MAIDPKRLTPDERDNLVAYLDGELGDSERQAIATKLAHSATARSEVEALRTTWDLLDHLPRPTATPALTERTISEIRGLADRDAKLDRIASRFRVGLKRGLVWGAVLAVSFLVGLIATRWVWPDRTARLARRLTIAEHLDEYESVGSFTLLELLEKSPDF